MRVTQRQVILWVLYILLGGTVLILATELFGNRSTDVLISIGVAIPIIAGLTIAYYRGWDYARYIVVAFITLLTAFGSTEPFITQIATLSIFVPPVIALIATTPIWVVGSAVATYGGLLARAGGTGVYADSQSMLLYVIIIGGMILSRLITDTAQRASDENARRVEDALIEAQLQADELARRTDELTEQNEQQRRLLDLVATLETPAVALANGVLLAPVVGHLDSRRAQDLTNRLLQEVSEQRARLVVLDIAGVSTVDTEVAHALLKAGQALRLLGCRVTITGISAAVAATITTLGISMEGVDTARTPQEALERQAALNAGLVPNGSSKRFTN